MENEAVKTAEEQVQAEAVEVEETVQAPVETMEDYKAELEASYRKIRPGDIVEGTVVDVNELEVTVDFNYYAPGKIAAAEMSNDPNFSLLNDVHVGDAISATVLSTDDGSGNFVLSRKAANDVLVWSKLNKMMEDRAVIKGKISGIVNGGAIMYVEGIRGFIPASKLDVKYVEDTNAYLNREVEAILITVDEEKKRAVLSCKELLVEKAIAEKNERINKIQPGYVTEGTVEQLMPYGAFVKIGDGISGLLHVSQISDKRIGHPKEALKVGETVKVKITRVENNKISLSIKELLDVTAKEKEPEVEAFNYKEDGKATTDLGSLLSGFKFD